MHEEPTQPDGLSPDQQARAAQLASEAMELPPPVRRDYVRAQAGDDEAVIGEVMSLLARAGDETTTQERSLIETPERIGPYRILGLIGRGGMGAVYKATDEREGGRKLVAIKVARKGLDTEDVLRRFELERQLLAALDHPNIARLYEANETEDGRPYFVMEHVDGQALDVYCDRNCVPIRERLELFRKVCGAVHHAHTNLIVHRDLKPGNILVTPEGEPKLLDFGIAKLLNPNLARVEALTGPAVRLMTPEYASPEQVRGDPVNTLSDVYSLGVLLYELLCGHRPYQIMKRLEAEIVRIVCETEPERPSTAIRREETRQRSDGTTETITPSEVAQRRAERVESLRRSLTGDLDDMVLMAMAKTPRRRYPSAADFSQDIERYLKGLPVGARRTHARAFYQMRKFVRRHRTPVAATLAAVLALLVGGVIAGAQYLGRVEAQRNELISAQFGGAIWTQAQRHLSYAMSPSDREAFWQDIEEAFEELADQYGEDNSVVQREKARALVQVGNTLGGTREGSLGDFHEALPAYEKARDTLAELARERPNDLSLRLEAAEAHVRVADMLERLDRLNEAMASYEAADELVEVTPGKTDEAKRMSRLASRVTLDRAELAAEMDDDDLASKLMERAIDERRETRRRFPDDLNVIRDLAVALSDRGKLLLDAGDLAEAEQALSEGMVLREELLALRPDHPSYRRDVAVVSIHMGNLRAAQDRIEDARQSFGRAEEILRTLSEERPDDARLPWTLSICLLDAAEAERGAGDDAAREDNLERANEQLDRLARLSPRHPDLPEFRERAATLSQPPFGAN